MGKHREVIGPALAEDVILNDLVPLLGETVQFLHLLLNAPVIGTLGLHAL